MAGVSSVSSVPSVSSDEAIFRKMQGKRGLAVRDGVYVFHFLNAPGWGWFQQTQLAHVAFARLFGVVQRKDTEHMRLHCGVKDVVAKLSLSHDPASAGVTLCANEFLGVAYIVAFALSNGAVQIAEDRKGLTLPSRPHACWTELPAEWTARANMFRVYQPLALGLLEALCYDGTWEDIYDASKILVDAST